MTIELARWVERLLNRQDVTGAIAALESAGSAAVRALLAGFALPTPRSDGVGGEDPRDAHDRLAEVLWLIASTDPGAIVAVLGETPSDTDVARLAYALGGSRAPSAVEALLPLLAHEHAHVRWSAIASLERIGTPEAVAPMPLLLNDRAASVRFAALRAVATHLPPGSKVALLNHMEREDLPRGAWKLATEALAKLEGTDEPQGR